MITPKIFVFGSNLKGIHRRGAAKFALDHRGAIYGQGWGRQGMSWALPTKATPWESLPLKKIEGFVVAFLHYAKENPHLTFEVTRVGCGLAGYTDTDIAPFFKDAPLNCNLPDGWRA